MPPVGFELKISAGERLQTYTLDRAATGTGPLIVYSTRSYSKQPPQITTDPYLAVWPFKLKVQGVVALKISEAMSRQTTLLESFNTIFGPPCKKK